MTTKTVAPPLPAAPVSSTGRRLVAIALGALVVALAAQVRVPLPFTPVPVTLQDLAVLTVGGVLGPVAGAAALVAYLALGIAGLPVYSGGASGMVWLFGPTGGYLLAFPVAAYAMGRVVARRSFTRALLGAALGMLIIHVGGVAQLALLNGDLGAAVRLGSLPFLPVSLLKVRDVGGGWRGLLKAIGWSVAFTIVGLVVGLPLVIGVGALLHGGLDDPDWFTTPGLLQALSQGVGLVVGFGVASFLIGRKVLRRSWEELRWRTPAPRGAWFVRGLALGAAAAALPMVLGLGAAGARWATGEGTWLGWFGSAVGTLLALALPALSEELVFRGLPLVLMAGVIGRWPAVVLTAVAFGLTHWTNPGITPLGLVNISLAGVLLGAAFYAPGGIWTAWGVHLGWNVALAALGAPVSGLPLGAPFLEYHPGGPSWVSGGGFGPEGGVLASLAMVGALAAASRWIMKGEGAA